VRNGPLIQRKFLLRSRKHGPFNQKPDKQETKTNVMNDAGASIGSLIIPPIGSGSLNPSATSTLIAALTSFNEGLIGPGHCQ